MWFNSWNKKFGTIPASYKEAMTYEEQILWLCKTVEELQSETGNFNYDLLINKPSINGVPLEGNKTLDNLAIQGKLIAGSGITINGNIISATGGGGGGGGASAVLLDSVVRLLNNYLLQYGNSQTELETQNQRYNFNNYYEGVIFTPTTLADNSFNCFYTPMNLVEVVSIVGTNIQFILTDANRKILYKSGVMTGTEENPVTVYPYALGFDELDYKLYINVNKADNQIKFSWCYPINSILENEKTLKERFNNVTTNLIESTVSEVLDNNNLDMNKAYNNSSAVVGELFTHLQTTESGKASLEMVLYTGEYVKITGNVSYVLCDYDYKCLKTESFNDSNFHEINPYKDGLNNKCRLFINVENTSVEYAIWTYGFNKACYELTNASTDFQYPTAKTTYAFVERRLNETSDSSIIQNLLFSNTTENNIQGQLSVDYAYNFAIVDVGDTFNDIKYEMTDFACVGMELFLGEYIRIQANFSYIICDGENKVLTKQAFDDSEEIIINPYLAGRKDRSYKIYINIADTTQTYSIACGHYLEPTQEISGNSNEYEYPTAKAVFDFASSTVNNQSITVLHTDLNLNDGTAPTLSTGFYTFETGKHCKINNVVNTLFDDSIFYYTALSPETNTPAFYFIGGKNINSQDLFNIRIFYSSSQYQNASGINPQTSWNKISNIPLVTSISSGSTDIEFPSAKCVYDSLDTLNTNIQGQFTASTTDLTDGSSPLTTGSYYFVYEA